MSKGTTLAWARTQVRKLLRAERAAHRAHLQAMKKVGRCMSDCHDLQRWNAAHELLLGLLESLGGTPTKDDKEWT